MIMLTFGFESKTNVLEQPSISVVPQNNLETPCLTTPPAASDPIALSTEIGFAFSS